MRLKYGNKDFDIEEPKNPELVSGKNVSYGLRCKSTNKQKEQQKITKPKVLKK